MADLDDKLKEIKYHYHLKREDLSLDVFIPLDKEAIAQIKQAFADEGYAPGAFFYEQFEKEFDKLTPLPKGRTERSRAIEAAKRASGIHDA